MRESIANLLNYCSGFPCSFRAELTANSVAYTQDDKQQARNAVDELLLFKQKYGRLMTNNINDCPAVERVMTRYQFATIDDLNDWLDTF